MDLAGAIKRNPPGFLFCVIIAWLTLKFEALRPS